MSKPCLDGDRNAVSTAGRAEEEAPRTCHTWRVLRVEVVGGGFTADQCRIQETMFFLFKLPSSSNYSTAGILE